MNPFRPPCWARALALIFLVCCGCAHKRSEEHDLAAELRATSSSEEESRSSTHAAVDSHETHTEAPSEVQTSKSQLGIVVQDAAGAVTVARVGRKPLALPKGSRIVGTVPLSEEKRDEKRGQVVDQKDTSAKTDAVAEAKGASSAAVAAKVKEKDKLKTSWSWWPPWWVFLLGGLALVAAGAIAWKLKPPWLGWLWKLLRRSPAPPPAP